MQDVDVRRFFRWGWRITDDLDSYSLYARNGDLVRVLACELKGTSMGFRVQWYILRTYM